MVGPGITGGEDAGAGGQDRLPGLRHSKGNQIEECRLDLVQLEKLILNPGTTRGTQACSWSN